MDAGINIGGDTKAEVEPVAAAIERVLRIGDTTHADQKTIRAALSTLERMGSTVGTTISSCYIHGDRVVNAFAEEEEEE